jgi:hypothetical protein
MTPVTLLRCSLPLAFAGALGAFALPALQTPVLGIHIAASYSLSLMMLGLGVVTSLMMRVCYCASP